MSNVDELIKDLNSLDRRVLILLCAKLIINHLHWNWKELLTELKNLNNEVPK